MISIYRKPLAIAALHRHLVVDHFNKFNAVFPELVVKFRDAGDTDEDEAPPEPGEIETDIYGDPIKKMQVIGNMAKIPVNGVVVKNWPSIACAFGFCELNQVAADIASAVANPSVDMIALDINSPGGYGTGLEEIYDQLVDAGQSKRIMAFTDDMMCSAAYYIACPAEQVFATKSSIVGSIGSYILMVDDTKFWEMNGIKWKLFSSGKYKGMGINSLTDEQEKLIQQQVDDDAAQFKKDVKQFRTSVEDDDMQGQIFTGSEAAEKGLVTGIAKNFQNALAKFSGNA